MSDEQKESRVNIEDLPQGERELTAEEAKDVAGGLEVKLQEVLVTSYQTGAPASSSSDEPGIKTK